MDKYVQLVGNYPHYEQLYYHKYTRHRRITSRCDTTSAKPTQPAEGTQLNEYGKKRKNIRRRTPRHGGLRHCA